MGMTRAQTNRAIRQEAIREQLAKQKHVEHVIDLLTKVESPDIQMNSMLLKRYKLAIDTRLALLKKYLPDLKQTEFTGENGGAIVVEIMKSFEN